MIPTCSPAKADHDLPLRLSLGSSPGLSPDKNCNENHRLAAALSRQAMMISTIWPNPTEKATRLYPAFMNNYTKIKNCQSPNYLGAKIPMTSDLNIPEWESRLTLYHDNELCSFLKFGWPLGYHALVPPTMVQENHPLATHNIATVRDYIRTELSFKAILGPFDQAPFDAWCLLSPMMTCPKKGTSDRRIILDLSYPKGRAVNDGISTTDHFGKNITYSLPMIADLVEILKSSGKGTMMLKSDLTGAYLQLRADPLDAPLLGLKVENKIYIDNCPPFGCRSSAAICQRVANALVFMMAQLGFKIIAYLDDFAWCHRSPREADHAFQAFNDLTCKLGLKVARHRNALLRQRWSGWVTW